MQKIFPEALPDFLSKSLASFYLLTGSDLLLLNESKDQIVQAARAAGFDEKQEVTIGNDTKWEALFEAAQSIGLFFSRQILILNLPENPSVTQMKNVAQLCAFSNADLLTILCLPKFTKIMEKQAWYALIEPKAVQINCQTPETGKLPSWLSRRAKKMELQLEAETLQFLCYAYEGNLLALKQALQLLRLRFPDGKISLARVKEIVEQSAQFTPFQWIDALLEGKIGRAERILKHLQTEEVQPVVLLRIIQKELLILLEISRSPQAVLNSLTPLYTGNLRAEFNRLKVWQSRRPFYQNAVTRLSYQKLYRIIQRLAELEKKVKQEFSDEIWSELERFSVLFN